MADVANHVFLPWVQPGALANVPDRFLERLAADQAAAVSLRISVLVNSTPVPQRVRLYGPRDVTGIDPQQIVRLEPRPYAADFEPNYFPFVEFDRHDFPWLFSPLKADAQGRLRPWIALVVIRTQPGVALNPSPPPALPVLTINPPASPRDELPDLAESYFWAHAQVTGVPTSQLNTVIDSDPARTVSRVICARRLRPSTEYLACLVPAFEVGRLAGLDTASDERHAVAILAVERRSAGFDRVAGLLLLDVPDERGRRFRIARAAPRAARSAARTWDAADGHQPPRIRDRSAAGTGSARNDAGRRRRASGPGPRVRSVAGRRAGAVSAGPRRDRRYAVAPDAGRQGRSGACGRAADLRLLARGDSPGGTENASRAAAVLARRAQPRSAPSRRGGDGHAGRPGSAGTADGLGVGAARRGRGDQSASASGATESRRQPPVPHGRLREVHTRVVSPHRGSCAVESRGRSVGARRDRRTVAARAEVLGVVRAGDRGLAAAS